MTQKYRTGGTAPRHATGGDHPAGLTTRGSPHADRSVYFHRSPCDSEQCVQLPLVFTALISAVMASAASSAPASFHAHLKKSLPAVNDTVATPPRSIRLWFTEKPEIALTHLTVSDASG